MSHRGCTLCAKCPGFRSVSKAGKFCSNCPHSISKHFGDEGGLPAPNAVSTSTPAVISNASDTVQINPTIQDSPGTDADSTHSSNAAVMNNSVGETLSLKDRIAKFSKGGAAVPAPVPKPLTAPKPVAQQESRWSLKKPVAAPPVVAEVVEEDIKIDLITEDDQSLSSDIKPPPSRRMSLKERIDMYKSQGASAAVAIETKPYKPEPDVVEEPEIPAIVHKHAKNINPLLSKQKLPDTPSKQKDTSFTSPSQFLKSARDLAVVTNGTVSSNPALPKKSPRASEGFFEQSKGSASPESSKVGGLVEAALATDINQSQLEVKDVKEAEDSVVLNHSALLRPTVEATRRRSTRNPLDKGLTEEFLTSLSEIDAINGTDSVGSAVPIGESDNVNNVERSVDMSSEAKPSVEGLAVVVGTTAVSKLFESAAESEPIEVEVKSDDVFISPAVEASSTTEKDTDNDTKEPEPAAHIDAVHNSISNQKPEPVVVIVDPAHDSSSNCELESVSAVEPVHDSSLNKEDDEDFDSASV